MAKGDIQIDVSAKDRASSSFDKIASSADKAGKKIESGSARAAKFGKAAAAAAKASAVAVTAVGVGFAGAIGSAIDSEKITDRLSAALGPGKKIAEKAGAVSADLYAGAWGDSMADVTQSVEAVATSFRGLSENELKRVSRQAMDFATIFETDVPTAVNAAQVAVKNGLAKNATEALDLLTVTSRKVPAALRGGILDATEEYSGFFKQLGLSGPQAFGLLAAGASQGQYGIDKAGDAVKEFTIRATDGSKATSTALESLGLNFHKIENDLLAGGDTANAAFRKVVNGLLSIKDPARRSQTALTLFGTPLEDLGTENIPKFLKALVGGKRALGNFNGAIDKAGATLNDNAATNLESFKRQMSQTFVNVVGGKVLPAVNGYAAALATRAVPSISKVSDFLSRHITVVKAVAIVVGVLTAITMAHGAAMSVTAAGGMAKWIASTRIVTTLTKVWTATQWLLNAAMLASPLTWIVIAIVAVVAAIVLIATKTNWFQKLWSKAWGAIKGAALAVWNWIKKNWPLLLAILTGPIGIAVLVIAKNWDKIKRGISSVKDWAVDKFNDIVGYVKGIPGRLKNLGASFLDAGKHLIGKIMSGLGKVGQLGIDIGRNLFNGVIDGINRAIGGINGFLPNKISIPGVPDIDLPDNPLPNIPHLARGGVVPATPGGRLIRAGEGGRDEAIVPLTGRGQNAGVSLDARTIRLLAAAIADAILTALNSTAKGAVTT